MSIFKVLSLYFVICSSFLFAYANESINILSLNMWTVPFQRQMTFARVEAAGKKLSNKEYDLILFQEAFTNGVRATLLHHIGTGYHNIFQRAPFGKLNSGIFNMSRYKITKSSFVPFLICGGIQCKAKKGIMYMQIELKDGQLVDTFNLHTQAYLYNDQIRYLQLKQLKSFIDSKNNGVRPVIVVGDFNIDGNGPEYPVIHELFPKMIDVWAKLNPSTKGVTWDPIKNYWASLDALPTDYPQRLDYILVRDGKDFKWRVNSAKIVFDQELPWIGGTGRENYIYVSDHYGVEANLSLVKFHYP